MADHEDKPTLYGPDGKDVRDGCIRVGERFVLNGIPFFVRKVIKRGVVLQFEDTKGRFEGVSNNNIYGG